MNIKKKKKDSTKRLYFISTLYYVVWAWSFHLQRVQRKIVLFFFKWFSYYLYPYQNCIVLTKPKTCCEITHTHTHIQLLAQDTGSFGLST